MDREQVIRCAPRVIWPVEDALEPLYECVDTKSVQIHAQAGRLLPG